MGHTAPCMPHVPWGARPKVVAMWGPHCMDKGEKGRWVGADQGGLSVGLDESSKFKTPLKESLPDSYPLGEDLHIKGLLF